MYSLRIYNHLQAPMLLSAPSSAKIINRFVPVVGVCSVALLISSVYYLCMATQLVFWGVANGYPYPTSSAVFDLIAFGSMEIIPSLALVFFLAHRKEGVSSEAKQLSYMSTVSAGPGSHSSQIGIGGTRKPPLSQSHFSNPVSSSSYKPLGDEGVPSASNSENI
jgi:hypothetical protein